MELKVNKCWAFRKSFRPLSAATLEVCLKEDFGTTIFIICIKCSSLDYTTLYPNKTDACANFEQLKGPFKSLIQRQKRQEKQDYRGIITRQRALGEINI